MGILRHVLESRALLSAILLVAVVAGGAPWRLCSHEHEGHGRVWLPDLAHLHEAHVHDAHFHDAHIHDAHFHGHVHAHGDGRCGHAPCAPADPCDPQAPCSEDRDEGGCHCSDQPLVTGIPFALVGLDAPAPVEWTVERVECGCELGVPEVAPSEPDRGRVAHEEDPIVLLR
jgi:hypothetical protein